MPLVCGHEFAGTIDKLGPAVEGFRPGERVAVFPLIWCGNCGPCERGQYRQCKCYNYLGSRSDGAFAEYVVAPVRNLIRVPDNVSLEEAAVTECAAVALHALRRAGNCSVGECVTVFWAGPIGLMVAQWAKAMGVCRLVLFDVVNQKLELARSLGLAHVYHAKECDSVDVVDELTGGFGAHVAVDAAGVPHSIRNAIQTAGRNGRVVLLGNPADGVTLPRSLISQMMRREVNIMGTWNSEYRVVGREDDWHTTLSAMSTARIDVKPLISHKVALRNAFDALKLIRDRKETYCKVLTYPESRN
jgi:L-iditol 2-dehydrogenase